MLLHKEAHVHLERLCVELSDVTVVSFIFQQCRSK